MKKLIILSFILFSLLACQKAQSQNQAVVILNDISGSMHKDSLMLIKEKGSLRRYLLQSLPEGEKVDIYTGFLFGNSASPTNLKSIEYNPKNTSRSIRIYKAQVAKKITRAVFSNDRSSDQTHILSSLRHIVELGSDYSQIALLLHTDLAEWSDIRRFSTTSFQTAEEAKRAGEQDAKQVMEKYGLRRQDKAKVKIEVYMPVAQTSHRSQAFLIQYWESALKVFFKRFTFNHQVL